MRARINTLAHVAAFMTVLGGLGWLLMRGSDSLNYPWHWERIPDFIYTWDEQGFTPGPLLEGLWVTIKISAVSLLLAFVFGLVTALLRLSDSFVGRFLARVYLETIRNTPLLTQILVMYFLFAPLLGLDAVTSGVLALSLFEGAYGSEIIRAGIVSIDKGQWEAAHSLGLSTSQTYRKIVLPQALRRVLPPLASLAVTLVKDSALVSAIAVAELSKQGAIIVARYWLTFETWFTVAALYLCLTIPLSLLALMLERRIKVRS
ncbi:MAG: amino acid ABC transporter permease [Desulfovibrio sp.]|nr:MAG: amino acid ABC transporter permease [Desulfovibrio sp.]